MAESWEVRGLLVRFNIPDLIGDVFTSESEFFLTSGETRKVPVYFHHGDDVLDRSIGEGQITLTSEGVAIKARIDLPNGYGAAMRRLARDGLLGWSSGSAGHIVRREKRGNLNYVRTWPIVEASLTPSPMMPVRNSRVLMKRFDYNEAAREIMAEMELRHLEMLLNSK